MKSIILLFTILASLAHANPTEISVKVQSKSKISYYDITANKIHFSDSQGLSQEKILSPANFQFLKSEVKTMTLASNDIHFCKRNYIQITMDKKTKLSCIGGKNKLTQQMESFLSLLTAAL